MIARITVNGTTTTVNGRKAAERGSATDSLLRAAWKGSRDFTKTTTPQQEGKR